MSSKTTPSSKSSFQDQSSQSTDRKKTAASAASSPELRQLEAEVIRAQESERRALADYQNLERRLQTERTRLAKRAALEVITQLLQPLDHLSMAAQQLRDEGLNMVVRQLWESLKQVGLEEVATVGQSFDPTRMEAVSKQAHGQAVITEISKGYLLNGEVVRPAKVGLD